MIETDYQTKLEEIFDPVLENAGVRLIVAREDLNHPSISGNKLRKLKYNLLQAREEGYHTILTLGGAYSNHIYATAAAANLMNFKSIGIIRGEEHLPLNPTLEYATRMGMQLHYMDRNQYRKRHQKEFQASLHQQYGEFYLVPEGGTNHLALKGCQEILESVEEPFDYILTASGTGGTLAGLVTGLKKGQTAVGVSVLKGGEFLRDSVQTLINNSGHKIRGKWDIITDYHFNGYARFTDGLIRFINNFKAIHHVPFDPVYTGKMMYAVWDLIKKDFFDRGSTIIALHTGGLQGIKGFNQRYGQLIK